MKKSIITLMALLFANTAMAEARDSSPRPVLRPASVERMSVSNEEINCLALNVYHESRSEGLEGQIAVAQVTMNRVEHSWFPDTVCSVVKQGYHKGLGKCQFSWYCDGRGDKPHERLAWINALDVADLVYHDNVDDPTQGALFYHTTWVRPIWRKRLDYFKTIGIHKFYHWDGNWNND